MQLTPYLISFPLPDDPTQTLLFATKTCAMILLPATTYADLRQGRVDAELAESLMEMGFWVESEDAERMEVMGYLHELNRLNPNLTLAIVLGLECNFRCRYCFEGEQKGNKAMDDATTDQLITFIKKRFVQGKKRLRLEVYGGEPLLYIRRLISLAQRLKPFVEERGGEFVIDLVSNGSLLTEKVVDELNRWGLDGVKVTLDGPPENHNHFRPFKSGEPSFEIIVANLAKVCGKTKIRLGGNYTIDNFRSFPPILDALAAKGITPERLERVNFNIVMQVKDQITRNEYLGGCCTINEPWLREAALYVREEVFRRGYPIAEFSPAPCAVEVDDAYTVNYDGGLYKCVTWVGHEQFRIGDVWRGVDKVYRENHHAFHWQKEAGCRECPYLPLCFGGCRYMAYQRDGHMAKVDCKKPFLDATLEKMLLQDLRYRYGAGE
ncbi:geopeptide radical SAM maturase [Thiovibrio sp. JS02]